MSGFTLSNWRDFLLNLIDLYDGGQTEQEISSLYRGSSVAWEGRVTRMFLDDEYVCGVDLSMGSELIPMARGKVLSSDHIALNVERESMGAWCKCEVGDLVRFTARVPEKSGPFSEIKFSEFEGEPEVVLMLGLVDCELVKLVKAR